MRLQHHIALSPWYFWIEAFIFSPICCGIQMVAPLSLMKAGRFSSSAGFRASALQAEVGGSNPSAPTDCFPVILRDCRDFFIPTLPLSSVSRRPIQSNTSSVHLMIVEQG